MIEELTYKNYQARQFYEVTYEGLRQRSARLKKAGKFRLTDSGWEPVSYEGFAILSMLDDHPLNSVLTARLTEIQDEIAGEPNAKQNYYFLPANSFHQTLANLLSEDRFRANILKKGDSLNFSRRVSSAFKSIGDQNFVESIDMKIAGVGIFGSALGVLGVFNKDRDFGRILTFREGIYSNELLNEYGILRTRPFIGHITLAYLENDLIEKDSKNLSNICFRVNQGIMKEDLHFYIDKTALRSYNNLACFHLGTNYPTIKI